MIDTQNESQDQAYVTERFGQKWKERDIPRRILVVEDDPDSTYLFYNIIRSLSNSIDVDSVTTAEKARQRLKTEKYDLIIADNYLLGLETGLDLWLYCSVFFPKLPFVVTSGPKVNRVIADLRYGGVSPNFILKPFNFTHAREMIRVLLESHLPNQADIEGKERRSFREVLKKLMAI
jgi:response regulator of citrate/malate metabolism